MERTLVIIKPDAVQRGLIGEIISRFEDRGLKLIALKFLKIGSEMAARHYGIHAGKPFYQALVDYIMSAPIAAIVWEGPNAVVIARNMVGATMPAESSAGSIRGDFAVEVGRNLIHVSDGAEAATKEIDLFFTEDEIIPWARDLDPWIFED